jgi:2'-5' RNA ligase
MQIRVLFSWCLGVLAFAFLIQPMRLFLAIELPQDVKDHLIGVRKRLEAALPKIAYTRAENLHLTLKFLGEVEKKRLAPITESLALIKTAPIELSADGIECFPHRGPINVLAASMTGTLPPLRALVESIEQRCKFLGFEKEQRAYRPHATIARARPVLSAKFRAAAEDATRDLWPGPVFKPAEFVLMDSHLTPEGSKYTAIARFGIG